MSLFRSRVLRRFSFLGRVADLALVGGLVVRFAQRQGLIDGADIDDDQPIGITELALGAAAIVRLLRRRKR